MSIIASYKEGSQPIIVVGIPALRTISAASGSTQKLYSANFVTLPNAFELPPIM